MSSRDESEKQEDFVFAANEPKQTKLTKFLATIDPHTIKAIQQYLKQHKQPQTDDKKWMKIKLYHDLLIILTFKRAEHLLKERKKIDELCEDLHKTINLSVSTIRERINKKLANVSPADIHSHIKHDIDFSFTSKRKLVDYHLPKSPNLPQQFNLGFVEPYERETEEELVRGPQKQKYMDRPESKIETKPETKPESKLEIKPECQAESQPDSKSEPKPKIENKKQINTLNGLKECNNDFLNLAQQPEDKQITIEINENKIVVGTTKEKQNTEKMCNKFESAYLKLRKKADILEQQADKQEFKNIPHSDVPIEIDTGSTSKSDKKKLKQITDICFNESLTLESYLMNPKTNSHSQESSKYFTKQFRKQSSSKINISPNNSKVQDEQLQQRGQTLQLKFDDSSNYQTKDEINQCADDDWGKEEDSFLRAAVSTNNIKDLNILLKYRKLEQVQQRIESLNLNVSELIKQYLKIA